MAIDRDAYEYGHVKDVHTLISVSENHDLLQSMWEESWARPQITIAILDELTSEFPAASRRIMSEAILMLSKDIHDRDPEVRSWFSGKVVPSRPITESAANTLATTARSKVPLAEGESDLATHVGLPDLVALAGHAFKIVSYRVAKKKSRNTAREVGTAGPRRSGLGRR